MNKQGVEIVVNARKEAKLINPETNYHLELDIFLPSLNLAFEYQVFISFAFLLFLIQLSSFSNPICQDKSHYIDVGYNRSLEEIKSSDKVKRQLAKEKGITLIPIPCWWDGTKSR